MYNVADINLILCSCPAFIDAFDLRNLKSDCQDI